MLSLSNKLIVNRGNRRLTDADECVVMSWHELSSLVRSGRILSHLLRYREVEIRVLDYSCVERRFVCGLLGWLLSLERCSVVEDCGASVRVNVAELARLSGKWISDWLSIGKLLREVSGEIDSVGREYMAGGKKGVIERGIPVYLRSDVRHGAVAGGSVTHISGVLNNLGSFVGNPVFFSCERIPTIGAGIDEVRLEPAKSYWDFRELPQLHANTSMSCQMVSALRTMDVSFLYERHCVYSYVGARVACRLGVPFVLEYNGSVVWIGRNWGRRLRYEGLAERIELLNLGIADVIVVVSKPMKDELVERGIESDKILVNPNGVDAERYHPGVDGESVRQEQELSSRTVVGFIGTFGLWHGAEVLVDAFGLLLKRRPALRKGIALLMIGDGVRMPIVKEKIKGFGIEDVCHLTGMVAQEDGPKHLAACDILASPHIPNPDGTPFFGSPTKLFEYMAMGKGIVASDLDQVGEVLCNDETAVLVRPGDPEALVRGLEELIDDPEKRARLGRCAREEAVNQRSWREHTRRIVDKLQERCG